MTPERRDFVITYWVEEGERYKFGDVTVESDIRDLKAETLQELVRVEKGDWYDAQKIENTVDAMAEAAGLQGYAFADVRPEFIRDKDDLKMTITFKVAEAPRVYVERVRSAEHTSELQSLMRISYAAFCWTQK